MSVALAVGKGHAAVLPPVQISWWCLLGIVTAIGGGVVWTLLFCRLKGFDRFRYRDLFRNQRGSFLWLGALDASGFLIAAILLWLIWPARLQQVLGATTSAPYIFWPLLGLLGPPVMTGTLRQLPARLRVHLPAQAGEIESGLYELRKSLSSEIYETAEQLTEAWKRTRNDWVNGEARRKHAAGEIRFDELRSLIERAHGRSRRRPGWAACSRRSLYGYHSDTNVQLPGRLC